MVKRKIIFEVNDGDLIKNETGVFVKIPKKELEGLFKNKQLKDVKPGETFKVGKFEFIKLDNGFDGKLSNPVILKNCLPDTRIFDDKTNNWLNSSLREFLNTDFYKELSDIIGAENIYQHNVNLITDDGLLDYGYSKDSISLLTTDMYRKYRKVIGDNLDKWWWTITALSTYETTDCVRVVSSNGLLGNNGCAISDGVRPFCILNSDIFVS